MTLTFDPLTLKVCGRYDVAWSYSVVSLIEIEQSPAELLTINDIFFVRFRGGCSNTARGDLKTRGPICTKLGGDIDRSSLHTEFKNDEDTLLGFETTAARNRALVSDKAKNRTF